MGGFRWLPRREVLAWCLFDFANSSYTTVIITVAFAVYFRDAVVGALDNRGDKLWGIANFLAMLTVALASPLAGALADHSGRRKRFLVVSTLVTVTATALLFFVNPGDVALAMILYIIGTVGFEGGYVFYNAFLPDISTPKTIGRISGWAWAVGYAGGLVSLAGCFVLLRRPLRDAAGAIDPAAVSGRHLTFLLVAAFFLVFALPAFFWLREARPQGRIERRSAYFTIGFRRVADTLSHLRRYREVAKYVAASLFFTDGITTVISFSAIYATTTFGFSSAEVVILFVVLNVVAFPGSVLAGFAADAIGPKRTIVATLFLWIGVVLVGAAADSKPMFWLMATGGAIGIGSTQAVGRSFMAQISPRAREAEFFGFYVLAGKFASMFGPLVFGLVSSASGNQKLAMLSLLPFFLTGLGFMAWVDEKKALREANDPGPAN